MVETAVDLFAEISFDDLLQFESHLVYNYGFASKHPVGKRIFDIISGWDKLVDFKGITYITMHGNWIERCLLATMKC